MYKVSQLCVCVCVWWWGWMCVCVCVCGIILSFQHLAKNWEVRHFWRRGTNQS
jgi:hypothetical protein